MGTKGIVGLLCAGAALLATCDAQGDQVPGNSSAAPPTLILRGGTVAAEVSIDAEFAESEEWADASPEFAEGVASSVAGQLRVEAGRVHVFDISETDVLHSVDKMSIRRARTIKEPNGTLATAEAPAPVLGS